MIEQHGEGKPSSLSKPNTFFVSKRDEERFVVFEHKLGLIQSLTIYSKDLRLASQTKGYLDFVVNKLSESHLNDVVEYITFLNEACMWNRENPHFYWRESNIDFDRLGFDTGTIDNLARLGCDKRHVFRLREFLLFRPMDHALFLTSEPSKPMLVSIPRIHAGLVIIFLSIIGGCILTAVLGPVYRSHMGQNRVSKN